MRKVEDALNKRFSPQVCLVWIARANRLRESLKNFEAECAVCRPMRSSVTTYQEQDCAGLGLQTAIEGNYRRREK
ncbi:MAG: hypothetical protein DWG76_07990 [Chloroflexi bacterium]|nr:hypothetical protein [Chloroflexota bacterium]